MYISFIVGCLYASSAVYCLPICVIRTLFFCRAANAIATQNVAYLVAAAAAVAATAAAKTAGIYIKHKFVKYTNMSI
jgi:hypothetical protein